MGNKCKTCNTCKYAEKIGMRGYILCALREVVWYRSDNPSGIVSARFKACKFYEERENKKEG